MDIIFGRKSISGSAIGGIPATQELLELCAKDKIYPDVKHITASQIDWAWDELMHNADGLRYVIDIKKSLNEESFLPPKE